MTTLDSLITQTSQLEETASKIQVGKEIGLSTEQIDKLIEDYDSWYGECLAILPDDLQEKFRFEYEGNWHSFKIKKFLESSTIVNPFYGSVDNTNPLAPSYWNYPYKDSFSDPIRSQRRILIQSSKRKKQMHIVHEDIALQEAISNVERLSRRFHLVTHQLKHRHNNRSPYTITDEYDVQNLFHAMLTLFFEDIRAEEWTPSYAGRNSRTDFLLKHEQIIVEIKKTRDGLTAKETGEQLIIDKARYSSHPDCRTLVAFVYDPDKKIVNPKGLERDLCQTTDNMIVKIIINQN